MSERNTPQPQPDFSGMKASSSASFGLAAMQHSISLADAKAGALIAATTALNLVSLTTLVNDVAPAGFPQSHLWTGVLAAASIATLFYAGLNAWLCVYPTFRRADDHAVFYYGSEVYEAEDTGEPVGFLSTAPESELLNLQANHVASLGCIARKKFDRVQVGFFWGGWGMALFLIGQGVRIIGL
jgi:hypothetical protein